MKSIISNIKFFLREAWMFDKSLFIWKAIHAIIAGIIPTLTALLYRNIVDRITAGDFFGLLFWAGLECIALFCLAIINNYINVFLIDFKAERLKSSYIFKCHEKNARLDLAIANSPAISTLREQAKDAVGRNVGITYFNIFFQLLSSIITIISLSAVLSTASPWAILFLCIVAALNVPILIRNKNVKYNAASAMAPINKELSYYAQMLTDPIYEKELRMYTISDWVLKKIYSLLEKTQKLLKDTYKKIFTSQISENFFKNIKTLFIYLFLGMQVIFQNLSFANFTMFISSFNNFLSALKTIITSIINIAENSLYAEALQKYLKVENVIAVDTPATQEITSKSSDVFRFSNVSFKYPGSSNYILKNINATFEKGKIYVIVGANGAGKTTLCNLLCRLYDTTNGTIEYLGNNIRDLNYKEYRNKIGMVFQDYKYYALTIAENVAMNAYDAANETREKVTNCLMLAGLNNKILSLPKGIDTPLSRLFEDDGILLSGGETQKLALAKMLFRDPEVVILDEPSSALDAFTENELMTTFMSALQGKTVFYISHRLSVAKKADAVVFINNNTIEDILPHNELMKKNECYATMYNIQAQQYIEED